MEDQAILFCELAGVRRGLTISSAKIDFLLNCGPGRRHPERDGEVHRRMGTMLGAMEIESDGRPPTPDMAATGDELFRLGLLYSTGQGGAPRDYVSAHMLFNLAAMRGSLEAKIYRKELSQEMDPADVAEAQRAARQWLAEG
jgi:hypothetical protein